jgi:NADPH:quinone reductase-like Zn-dependent oxidoreductase
MASMKAVRFAQYGPPSVLTIEPQEKPVPGSGECLIQVHAAAINPSDVKNVAGAFKTQLPRTPGRDYAGSVVAGEGKGREIWGSGAGFGVERDGSHAQFIVVPADWLADKPQQLSMSAAASVGVPFVVAWDGLIDAASLQAGETVLVTGAGGAVGRAVTQIAHWRGARVLGADLADEASDADVRINLRREDLVASVKAATANAGVDLVFDAVGGALFEKALQALRIGGRQIAISSTGERRVSFDLIDFYHQRLRLIGIDSLKLSGARIASILNALRPGFESGQLKASTVKEWPLEEAASAYAVVERGAGAVKQVLLTA